MSAFAISYSRPGGNAADALDLDLAAVLSAALDPASARARRRVASLILLVSNPRDASRKQRQPAPTRWNGSVSEANTLLAEEISLAKRWSNPRKADASWVAAACGE